MAGPLFGRIKKGETITLEDGRVLNPTEFIGPQQPGRKVSICFSQTFCFFTVLLETLFLYLNLPMTSQDLRSSHLSCFQKLPTRPVSTAKM